MSVSRAIALGLAVSEPSSPAAADADPPEPTWTAEQRQHWSFVPPKRPEPPAVEAHGLGPQPDRRLHPRADRGRRARPRPRGRPGDPDPPAPVRPDGLPPTPEEVDAFVADAPARRLRAAGRPPARLARSTASAGRGPGSTWPASPRATASRATRPAPTPGGIATGSIKALNADMPYDRFVALQLAGDEVAPGRPRGVRRHRLQPELAVRGQQHGPRPEPAAHARRHDRHDRLGLPRPDRRLRPLPRPQVRPDQPEGLLPVPGPLRRDRAEGRLRRSPRPSSRPSTPRSRPSTRPGSTGVQTRARRRSSGRTSPSSSRTSSPSSRPRSARRSRPSPRSDRRSRRTCSRRTPRR